MLSFGKLSSWSIVNEHQKVYKNDRRSTNYFCIWKDMLKNYFEKK